LFSLCFFLRLIAATSLSNQDSSLVPLPGSPLKQKYFGGPAVMTENSFRPVALRHPAFTGFAFVDKSSAPLINR
jgi:hypothetical protein